uniref:Cyclopropane fatty-acyl-phospholipid synthase n=1 Tax=Candidatus Kentrum sp. DK TaxID=2126562 RepID=A0A450SCN8_9GAMM|nr:MAG: Cyclopropane fatty-acyl-phospholipid synthase [Candidatus Kentron sp. DK]
MGKEIDVQGVIEKHYRALGENYDNFVYYSPEYVRALTGNMIEKLQLTPDDVLADIGCGTGMYSLDILKQIPLRQRIIGVDPYPEMISKIPADAHITPIVSDALVFSRQKPGYNKVLMKDVVHHLPQKEAFFANIYDNLPPGGIMLLVHTAPDFQYPLFDAALERNLTWLSHPDELTRLLENAGFRVEAERIGYPLSFPKAHYFKMVRAGYMSVLTSFSEAEREEGLAEMAARYADTETLAFTDYFDYLTATKGASS